LGTVLPYSHFVPWIIEHGPNFRLLVPQLFANRVSAFFGLDVFAIVLLGFIGVEGQRLGMRLLWLPIVGLLTVDVSVGLPLFLYLRQRALKGSPGAGGGVPAAKS
jgi:hypothetical protein